MRAVRGAHIHRKVNQHAGEDETGSGERQQPPIRDHSDDDGEDPDQRQVRGRDRGKQRDVVRDRNIATGYPHGGGAEGEQADGGQRRPVGRRVDVCAPLAREVVGCVRPYLVLLSFGAKKSSPC